MSDLVENAPTHAPLGKHVTFNMNRNKVYIVRNPVPITPKTSKDTEGVIKVTDYQRKTHMDVSKSNTSCKKVSRSILKRVTSFCNVNTPTFATSSTPAKHFCTSGSALSSSSAAKSAPVLLQRSGAASKERISHCAVGSIVESDVCNKSASSSKMENLPDLLKTSVSSTKTAEPPVTHIHADVTNSLPTPYLNTTIPASSKHKTPQKDHCHEPAGKTTPSRNLPAVGLSQLVIVSCEAKRQVYCQLCSVKLSSSSHSRRFDHCFNYVKMKYPGWTASPLELEKVLSSIVARLAELERSLPFLQPQIIEVNKGMYWFLASLPEDKAVETVKALLRQKHPRVSSSTGDTTETLGLEVSSSDDGVHVLDNEISGVCDKQIQTDQIQMTETVQQDSFDPDAETKGEVTDVSESPQVAETLVGPGRWRPPAAETQQWKRDLTPLDKELFIRPQKVPRVQTCSLQPQTAAVTEQQNPSRPSYRAELAPEQGAEPGEQRASQEEPRALLGGTAQGFSHLSFYLKARRYDSKPVIGMASVWECRGFCQDTFFLCESCEDILSHRDICLHLVSQDHQLKYLWREYPQFLNMFWLKEDLPSELRKDILKDVVREVAERERDRVDAPCVLLEQELHQFVRTTHFIEALNVMRFITNEETASVNRSNSTTHQKSMASVWERPGLSQETSNLHHHMNSSHRFYLTSSIQELFSWFGSSFPNLEFAT